MLRPILVVEDDAKIAHELRTPLSNLRGYLEAVRDGVTPVSAETVALLHEEVMRMVRLVQALHELSLFDAGLPRVRRQSVEVSGLVRRALELRRGEFAAGRITVQSDIGDAVPVSGDPDLLAQALHNLLDNALKYTPVGGQVEVRTSQAGGQARIAVTNRGVEIPPDDLPYIFERFYRGDRSRSRDSGGAGIGLAIVKEIARVHGGDVGADSGAGETTVWLTVDTSVHPSPV